MPPSIDDILERLLADGRSEGGTAALVIEEAASLIGIMIARGPLSWPETERLLRHVYASLSHHRSDLDLVRAADDLELYHPSCGTINGYQRHRRHGELACDECKKAAADYERTRYVKVGTSTRRKPLAEHGTTARYRMHIKDGEKACEPCRDAWREYRRAWEKTRPRVKRGR